MSGHHHNPNAGTQNQGNSLGDRSCVRQSKLYRQYESGNGVKDILGSSHLRWDADRKEGAYKGQKVFDHNAPISVGYGESRDPKYEAHDLKSSINNNYSSYSGRAPARSKYDEQVVERHQAPTRYEDQDRSVANIGGYQGHQSGRDYSRRHDVPQPIEQTYQSLKSRKARDDDYDEPVPDRRQGSSSRYEDQDRSVSNIGGYQGHSARVVDSGRNRHEVPSAIEQTYKSLKAQKNKDDFRSQGRGYGEEDNSRSLAKYSAPAPAPAPARRGYADYEDDEPPRRGGGAAGGARARFEEPAPEEEDDGYNPYSDRNYGLPGRPAPSAAATAAPSSKYGQYGDENAGYASRNASYGRDKEDAYEEYGRGGKGAAAPAASSSKGNKSTRPW